MQDNKNGNSHKTVKVSACCDVIAQLQKKVGSHLSQNKKPACEPAFKTSARGRLTRVVGFDTAAALAARLEDLLAFFTSRALTKTWST